MNFVWKSFPVNSRLLSRKLEYQLIEAGFLTFPALRGLPDCVSGMRSQAFPVVAPERDYSNGHCSGFTPDSLSPPCRKQAVHLNPLQKYVNYLSRKNKQR